MLKVKVGRNPLAHSCRGNAISFSKTPVGGVQESQETIEKRVNRERREFFNECDLCKIMIFRLMAPAAGDAFSGHYNTFKTCSFAFSSSSFIRTTHCWIVES